MDLSNEDSKTRLTVSGFETLIVLVTTSSSPAQTAAALLLGEDVCEWVEARKSQPDKPSWRIIAYDLNRAMNDDRLVLSEQTVKSWWTPWNNARKARLASEVGAA